MADISVSCPACNHVCKISEYVSEETIPCPVCGEPVQIPKTSLPSEASIQSTLRLKKNFKEGLVEKKDAPLPPRKEIKRSSSMEKIHQVKGKPSGPKAIWGVLTLLIAGGGMFYLLYAKDQNADFLKYYLWMRNGIGLLALGLVYLSAFQESHVQGLLTVLIPPYALYYVYARADSCVLRALFTALIIALGAEFKYMHDKSLLIQFNESVAAFIQGGESLIDAANKDVETTDASKKFR